ncbi:hypothetical protein BZA77DRAFT_86975 [Pyronema omphalodes]|nr:hypothetical protein BZA77DRAFT_86975 [Pyronema omphalodes]
MDLSSRLALRLVLVVLVVDVDVCRYDLYSSNVLIAAHRIAMRHIHLYLHLHSSLSVYLSLILRLALSIPHSPPLILRLSFSVYHSPSIILRLTFPRHTRLQLFSDLHAILLRATYPSPQHTFPEASSKQHTKTPQPIHSHPYVVILNPQSMVLDT